MREHEAEAPEVKGGVSVVRRRGVWRRGIAAFRGFGGRRSTAITEARAQCDASAEASGQRLSRGSDASDFARNIEARKGTCCCSVMHYRLCCKP